MIKDHQSLRDAYRFGPLAESPTAQYQQFVLHPLQALGALVASIAHGGDAGTIVVDAELPEGSVCVVDPALTRTALHHAGYHGDITVVSRTVPARAPLPPALVRILAPIPIPPALEPDGLGDLLAHRGFLVILPQGDPLALLAGQGGAQLRSHVERGARLAWSTRTRIEAAVVCEIARIAGIEPWSPQPLVADGRNAGFVVKARALLKQPHRADGLERLQAILAYASDALDDPAADRVGTLAHSGRIRLLGGLEVDRITGAVTEAFDADFAELMGADSADLVSRVGQHSDLGHRLAWPGERSPILERLHWAAVLENEITEGE